MNNEEKYEDVISKIVTYINGAQTDEVLVQDLVSQDTNVVVDCNMRGPNMENDNPYANVNRCDGRAQIDGISDDVSGLQYPRALGQSIQTPTKLFWPILSLMMKLDPS